MPLTLFCHLFKEKTMSGAKKTGGLKKTVKEETLSKTAPAEIDKLADPHAEEIAAGTTEAVDKQELSDLRKLKADYDKKNLEIIAKKNDYEYFADFDKGSSMPAWSLKTNTDMLGEDVSRLGNALKNNQVPLEEVAYAEMEYKMKKERLDKINNSMPKLSGRQVDELREKRDTLSGKLRDGMFTRLQMEKGLVDPHEEAARMSEPCIEVDKKEFARMGMTTTSGKVSRSEAELGWKMMNGLLGDGMNVNTETLRRDTGHSKRDMVTVSNLPPDMCKREPVLT